ncbi:hypothetical protein [Caldimonas thermodepolymerans]|jgi:hypothetical protein|uniref:hypothetical protein n=1 Tax=Caldimonas thermodepolymerans TaxID=215580 RepID=UPI000E2DF627|nr:hypothetical protein [Caldimonas thermodepolymerans]RDI01646.1 hypothetical protein DES46_103209 [Caldimonas thermodepolymerans]
MPVRTVLSPALAAAALAFSTASHAGEVYGNIGLPGLMIGYAHAVNDRLTLRADVASIGSISADGREEGIEYDGKARLNRAGLFADWFVFGSGGFRLTGGITINDMRINLRAQGSGQTVHIGDTDYVLSADDRLDVRVKFPTVTPYIGIGWGHQPQGTGWGFVADLGASIGKAKVRGKATGPTLDNPAAQEDFRKELDELRDGVGKVRFVPQLSIGVSYRF